MSSTQSNSSAKSSSRISQPRLLGLAVLLLVVAGFLVVHYRGAWVEFTREWRTKSSRDLAELDERATGRNTGVVPGAVSGKLERFSSPTPLSPEAVTSDWPHFLGPNKNCTSPETHLRKDWPEEGPPLVWTRTSGATYATPAIRRDRLVYFYRFGSEEIVACLNAETGDELWDFRYPTDYQDEVGYGGGPKCAPVIDDDRVYTYGVQGRLHCLELATGKLLWKRWPKNEFDVPKNFFGVGDAPLVEGDLLMVTVGAPEGPCVVAYDKLTGDMVWGTGDTWRAGYASPVAGTVNGKRRIFVFTGGDTRPPVGGLMMIDPDRGHELFRFPWRSRLYKSVNASTPVVVGNQVFISSSYRKGGALLQIEADDSYHELWTTTDLATHFMTPVYQDGYLYGFDGQYENDTTLVCLEWATGKLMWRELIKWTESHLHGGVMREDVLTPGRGSLLQVDGHFLCLGEMGHLLWLDLSPEGCVVLDRAWLFRGREIWGLPVVSRGLLYINQSQTTLDRDPPRLLCYDLRSPTG